MLFFWRHLDNDPEGNALHRCTAKRFNRALVFRMLPPHAFAEPAGLAAGFDINFAFAAYDIAIVIHPENDAAAFGMPLEMCLRDCCLALIVVACYLLGFSHNLREGFHSHIPCLKIY